MKMQPRIKIITIAALILIGTGTIFSWSACSSKGPGGEGGGNLLPAPSKAKEITIRNVTKDVVMYSLTPLSSNKKPIEKILPVGAIHRILATETMIVKYKKNGEDVTFSLVPGKPYSFRYDTNGLVDIWIGSHGREDAEDLAPYVPTPEAVVAKMLEMAQAGKDDVLIDIGCGDGRIVITAAKKFGTRGVGIDIDPQRIKECHANAKSAGVENLVTFRQEDATKTDISEATIISLYLLPESNELLRPKFERELKPGTRVVSHNYDVPGWEDKEISNTTVKDDEGNEHYIYLYKK